MRMDLQERRSKLKLKNSKSTKSRSEMESSSSELREEIVFMDVETTVPFRTGQGFALLEFGAILVCPRKLVELESYSTLIRPADLSSLSSTSVRSNGITREAVAGAPSFAQVADKVYDILHGRVWAGHNILRFDCVRIRDAFMEIGRAPPVPKGTIDSLALLTQKFGRRAGDMKMASLANYFGLGQQKHRSLDDVRMNLEVVKYCATVLFLESCLPEIFTTNSWISPNATTRSRRNGITSPDKISPDPLCHSVLESGNHLSSPNGGGKIPEIVEISKQVPMAEPFDLLPLIDQMKIDSSAPHNAAVERPATDTPQMFSGGDASLEACSSCVGFLNPDEVSIQCISTSLAPAFRGWGSRIHLMHKDFLLQLCCMKMRICFGVSAKFLDYAGRPRLSIVVYPSPSLCLVLDACDQLVQKVFLESGSSSEWRPVVMRKNGSSTIRLHIPTIATGDSATYSTEIYQREASGNSQRLLFSKVDAAELDSLFIPGNCIDAFFLIRCLCLSAVHWYPIGGEEADCSCGIKKRIGVEVRSLLNFPNN